MFTNLPLLRHIQLFRSCSPCGDARLPSVSCDSRSQQPFIRGGTLSRCNRPFWPMVQLKVSLNVPKRFFLAAEEPCRCAALWKAATNWTLTTTTSVRHAKSAVIAPVQRRTNQPDGPMPHLEVIHSLKKRAGRGRGFTGTGSMAHFLSLCFLFGRLCLPARMHVCLCASSDFSWTHFLKPLRY